MIEQLFEPVVMLMAHAAVVCALTVVGKKWLSMDVPRVLAFIGATQVLLFTLCVGVPFFFQGYSDATEIEAGISLGWTANSAIGFFSYFYTFPWNGFAWLTTAVVCIGSGRFSRRVGLEALARSAFILLACIMLVRLDAFAATINVALE